jgi:hypothetical protein
LNNKHWVRLPRVAATRNAASKDLSVRSKGQT